MQLRSFPENILILTSRIVFQYKKNKKMSSATGFFIEVVSDDLVHGNMQLLIFNSRAFKEKSARIFFGLRYSHSETEIDDGTNEVLFAPDSVVLEPMRFFSLDDHEVFHYDEEILDVRTGLSAIDVSNEWDLMGDSESRTSSQVLSQDSLLSHSEHALFCGQEVFFLSHSDNSIDATLPVPTIQCARITSDPLVDLDGQPQFLIEGHVPVEAIGSPVFVTLEDGHDKLVGVIATSGEESGSSTTVNKVTALKDFFDSIVLIEKNRFTPESDSIADFLVF